MKLTPWFRGVKPARPGVYQQRAGCGSEEIGYQRWDGWVWYIWCDTPDEAANADSPASSRHQNDPWRGLAEDPAPQTGGGYAE